MKQAISKVTAFLATGTAFFGSALELKIKGMSCKLCAARIEKKLTSQCQEAHVNFGNGFGTCVPKKGISSQEVLKTVQDMGFEAQAVQQTKGKNADE